MSDNYELMEEYFNLVGTHCLEGDRGLATINQLCADIGYKSDGFRYGSALEKFLSDNPGCCEKLVNWMFDHLSEEQKENLESVLPECDEDEDDEDEDDEDDEDEDDEE
jgi:hypothetical protein